MRLAAIRERTKKDQLIQLESKRQCHTGNLPHPGGLCRMAVGEYLHLVVTLLAMFLVSVVWARCSMTI